MVHAICCGRDLESKWPPYMFCHKKWEKIVTKQKIFMAKHCEKINCEEKNVTKRRLCLTKLVKNIIGKISEVKTL